MVFQGSNQSSSAIILKVVQRRDADRGSSATDPGKTKKFWQTDGQLVRSIDSPSEVADPGNVLGVDFSNPSRIH